MNAANADCGVVILNYNDYETTRNLLDRIKGYESLSHIVVVDNHSTDDSYQRLCEHESEKVKVLLAPGNDGYSKGNNIGVRYLIENTDDGIICIANSDVEFEEELVVRILGQFARRPDYAVITGLQVRADGSVAGHPFWPEYSVREWLAHELSGGRLLRHVIRRENYIERKLAGDKPFFSVGAVEGSLFFIRRNDFERIGLFDEGVWFYYEEDMIAKKIKRIGKKIGVDSAVRYIHYGSGTTSKVFVSHEKIDHMFRSSVYCFNHYLSENRLLQGLNYMICYAKRIENILVMCVKKKMKTDIMKNKCF